MSHRPLLVGLFLVGGLGLVTAQQLVPRFQGVDADAISVVSPGGGEGAVLRSLSGGDLVYGPGILEMPADNVIRPFLDSTQVSGFGQESYYLTVQNLSDENVTAVITSGTGALLFNLPPGGSMGGIVPHTEGPSSQLRYQLQPTAPATSSSVGKLAWVLRARQQGTPLP